MLDLEAIEKLIADTGPELWIVTERSSPGWRVETHEGNLVCYGPEQLHEAARGRFIAQARLILPELVREHRELLTTNAQLLDVHTQCLTDLSAAQLVIGRLRELLDSEDVEGDTVAAISWALEPVAVDSP